VAAYLADPGFQPFPATKFPLFPDQVTLYSPPDPRVNQSLSSGERAWVSLGKLDTRGSQNTGDGGDTQEERREGHHDDRLRTVESLMLDTRCSFSQAKVTALYFFLPLKRDIETKS
jgi:hypothetical protein